MWGVVHIDYGYVRIAYMATLIYPYRTVDTDVCRHTASCRTVPNRTVPEDVSVSSTSDRILRHAFPLRRLPVRVPSRMWAAWTLAWLAMCFSTYLQEAAARDTTKTSVEVLIPKGAEGGSSVSTTPAPLVRTSLVTGWASNRPMKILNNIQ